MFAVVRHTYQLHIPDPSNPFSTQSSAKWIHKVWIFPNEVDALAFAITLLDDPLIFSNEWLLKSAIHQLEDALKKINEEEEEDNEKSIH